jgi:glycosyltransferase involved in cell wall biosynthesis
MMVHMALWESYCNVVHEGLSQGKVCIVADNTALPLLIKNDVNGYCVETTDHEELAKKINYVLENKQTKKIIEMEKRNQEIGLLNSWEQVSQKLQAWNLHLMNGYDK